MKKINSIGTLVLTGVISAIVGGSGFTGIAFLFMRRYIEKKLDAKDQEEEKRKKQKLRRMTVEDKMQHCTGRLLFWMHKAIVDGTHNGDLEDAFEKYQKVEEEKKNLDREIISEQEID